MITVRLAMPDAYARRAEYVFGVLAQQWGIPIAFVPGSASGSASADITYGGAPPEDASSVHVPFDAALYEAGTTCAAVRENGHQVWAGPANASSGDPASVDLVASTYRLLTFLDEHQVDDGARDRRGVFRTEALPTGRRQVTGVPLVDDHAASLLRRLEQIRPGVVATALPKWPGGKRYAVVVSHDTDAVTLGAPRELLTNLAKLLVRRNRTYAGMVGAGLRYFRDPTGNPLFGFPLWRDLELEQRIRSTFYLYTRLVRLKADLNNCKSSVVEQPIDWDVLRRMVNDGWEFGLHAPINARHDIDALAGGKQWIEEQLGSPVYGLRHHYWALDWTAPHTTWRKHVNSGFRYDTSIAWRDVGGFRAATCHPFRPFDPKRGKPLDIYELPTCLMDGHVVGRSGDVAVDVAAGLETVERVKERGGVAVLDWHTESACNVYEYTDTLTTLVGILEPLLADTDAWFATAWEVSQHWHQRRKQLAAAR